MALAIPGYEKMRFSVLGSGSRGNSVYIESGKTGVLIDAGFSGKELEKRLSRIDRKLSDVKTICITHEHHDHITGAGVLSRRCNIPVLANTATFLAAEKRLGKLYQKIEFETGDRIEFQDLSIRSFRISHDTADPVGFVMSDNDLSVGYCTDTGKVSHLMETMLSGFVSSLPGNCRMLLISALKGWDNAYRIVVNILLICCTFRLLMYLYTYTYTCQTTTNLHTYIHRYIHTHACTQSGMHAHSVTHAHIFCFNVC